MFDPERTLAIVCGAKDWPNLPNFTDAEAFANTAELIRCYLTGEKGLRLSEKRYLWLFGEPASADEQYDLIGNFLVRQFQLLDAPRGKNVLVLFFYIGHGAFFPPLRGEYCLLVRDTRGPVQENKSLRVASLARLFRQVAGESSRILFLDCCFAGYAARPFIYQSELDQVVSRRAQEAVQEAPADQGVALLCASSSRDPARLESLTSYTLFGRELNKVLTEGDSRVPGALTLRQVCELVGRGLRSTAGDDAPNPEVHVPDQARGDLAAVPLFPNPAWHGPASPRLDDDQVNPRTGSKHRSIDPQGSTTSNKSPAQASRSSSVKDNGAITKLPKQITPVSVSKVSQELRVVHLAEPKAVLVAHLAELDELTTRPSQLERRLSDFDAITRSVEDGLQGYLQATPRSRRAALESATDDFIAATELDPDMGAAPRPGPV